MITLSIYKHIFRLLLSPEKEWPAILNDTNISNGKLNVLLVITLPLLMSACNFMGFLLFENNTAEHTNMFFFSATATFVLSILSIYVSVFIVRPFAAIPTKRERFSRAFLLVAFSCTPGFVFNSIAFLFPVINYLTLFGLYSFYILYKGITPILNVPDSRRSGYFTFILIGLLSVYAIFGAIFIGTANFLGY
ncbi:Yip1 family protein [Marinifilum sp.]|uniref:Yip1 family protein n=1 Tax=Marinifilum sp. TaxID=2033137 RepID=UPI003BAB0490